MERLWIPLYVPNSAHAALRGIKRALTRRQADNDPVDLSGDREIEWSFVSSRIPPGPGEVLDFGSGTGTLSLHAIQRGHRVVALDLEPHPLLWSHPNLWAVRGDVLDVALEENSFDVVLNCSTVEHVGLAGRYSVAAANPDGDLAAMRRLRTLLKPSGLMLLTIPCGRDTVMAPWHRVYGPERLPLLLSGYDIQEQSYWLKRGDNRWHPAARDAALTSIAKRHPSEAVRCSYALGCFALRRTSPPARSASAHLERL